MERITGEIIEDPLEGRVEFGEIGGVFPNFDEELQRRYRPLRTLGRRGRRQYQRVGRNYSLELGGLRRPIGIDRMGNAVRVANEALEDVILHRAHDVLEAQQLAAENREVRMGELEERVARIVHGNTIGRFLTRNYRRIVRPRGVAHILGDDFVQQTGVIPDQYGPCLSDYGLLNRPYTSGGLPTDADLVRRAADRGTDYAMAAREQEFFRNIRESRK